MIESIKNIGTTAMLYTRLMVATLTALLVVGTLHAQGVSMIKASPDAKQLRKIWELKGGPTDGVGLAVGSVGDINGDSLADWAVYSSGLKTWNIFYGSHDTLSTTPAVTLRNLDYLSWDDAQSYPVVGDFWGTGHKAIALPSRHSGAFWNSSVWYEFYELHIFRTDSNRIDTVPDLILDVEKMKFKTRVESQYAKIRAADLDNDGADELILSFGAVSRIAPGGPNFGPETWIFKGGADFQLNEPTLILEDANSSANYVQTLFAGHFDNDDKLDLIIGSYYESYEGTYPVPHMACKLKCFFGNEGSPWNWSQPDREMEMRAAMALDCDGDGMLDLASGNGTDVLLFLSSSGKNIRTRSFSSADADRILRLPGGNIYPRSAGYLSDSSRQYEMMAVQVNYNIGYQLNGGPNGPDAYYDSYSNEYGSYKIKPIGDCNGDGWDDLLSGDPSVPNPKGAVIFAGGPYIPSDRPSGVERIASDERSDAISIWPNPATTEVHIAWRGDLKRMPRRFVIHDVLGRLVAQGEVESWRGEAVWQCSGAQSGIYMVDIQDYRGSHIASARIVRQ